MFLFPYLPHTFTNSTLDENHCTWELNQVHWVTFAYWGYGFFFPWKRLNLVETLKIAFLWGIDRKQDVFTWFLLLFYCLPFPTHWSIWITGSCIHDSLRTSRLKHAPSSEVSKRTDQLQSFCISWTGKVIIWAKKKREERRIRLAALTFSLGAHVGVLIRSGEQRAYGRSNGSIGARIGCFLFLAHNALLLIFLFIQNVIIFLF